MIEIIIVDDQDLVRAGLRALLAADPELSVVAEADNGERGLSMVRQYRPRVVLMDLHMPGTDGLAATREIVADERLREVRVLVLTTFDSDEEIRSAIEAGAAGYLLKDTGADDLRRAIHTVADGGNLLSPAITRRVMQRLAEVPRPPEPDPRLARLTERELAVLVRVGHGDTNDEIGRALHISSATARTYVSRLLTKLDSRDRTQLAVLAHRSGLVTA